MEADGPEWTQNLLLWMVVISPEAKQIYKKRRGWRGYAKCELPMWKNRLSGT